MTIAIGPLGYIYWPGSLPDDKLDDVARKLVAEANIPIVMAAAGEAIWAWTTEGKFRMPEEAEHVLAPDHPFFPDVAEDLAALCRHPDAGTFLISGWRNGPRPITFVAENGDTVDPARTRRADS